MLSVPRIMMFIGNAVEISVEDCKIVYAADFWPYGTRIRPFFHKRNVADSEPFRRNDSETGD